jgi:hypothetical protein
MNYLSTRPAWWNWLIRYCNDNYGFNLVKSSGNCLEHCISFGADRKTKRHVLYITPLHNLSSFRQNRRTDPEIAIGTIRILGNPHGYLFHLLN